MKHFYPVAIKQPNSETTPFKLQYSDISEGGSHGWLFITKIFTKHELLYALQEAEVTITIQQRTTLMLFGDHGLISVHKVIVTSRRNFNVTSLFSRTSQAGPVLMKGSTSSLVFTPTRLILFSHMMLTCLLSSSSSRIGYRLVRNDIHRRKSKQYQKLCSI